MTQLSFYWLCFQWSFADVDELDLSMYLLFLLIIRTIIDSTLFAIKMLSVTIIVTKLVASLS